MKKLFVVATLLLCAFALRPANAMDVWYQPTPYPEKKWDGSPMPADLAIRHFWEGWLSSQYQPQLQQDDKLQIGGWNDLYLSFIKFDLAGLPQSADYAVVYLMPYSRGDGSTSTPFASCSDVGTWDLSLQWNPNKYYYSCRYWYSAPTAGTWTGFWLEYPGFVDWYNQWKNGTLANEGIAVIPKLNNNNFDVFRSSRYSDYVSDPYADGKRPMLYLSITPTLQLKMPLPGNHSWLVTTEIGGWDCKGTYDQYHDGTNYFSVDFSWKNNHDNGATVYAESSNIPVIAAAGGTVSVHPGDPSNGNYVVVTHGSSGFTTRYLHLDSIAVSDGASVSQGGILGYMGNTGLSDGKHLHFGVRYNNDGSSNVANLTKVVMDGWLLKSFQTECTVDGNGVPQTWNRYYRSGNTVY